MRKGYYFYFLIEGKEIEGVRKMGIYKDKALDVKAEPPMKKLLSSHPYRPFTRP